MSGANTRSFLARFCVGEGEGFCKNLSRQKNMCVKEKGTRARAGSDEALDNAAGVNGKKSWEV